MVSPQDGPSIPLFSELAPRGTGMRAGTQQSACPVSALAPVALPCPLDLQHSLPGAMEKEMATHSSILAWEILWTEGRLQSTGSQKSWTQLSD